MAIEVAVAVVRPYLEITAHAVAAVCRIQIAAAESNRIGRRIAYYRYTIYSLYLRNTLDMFVIIVVFIIAAEYISAAFFRNTHIITVTYHIAYIYYHRVPYIGYSLTGKS